MFGQSGQTQPALQIDICQKVLGIFWDLYFFIAGTHTARKTYIYQRVLQS